MKSLLLAVVMLAVAGSGPAAFAEIVVGGSIDTRSRLLNNAEDLNDSLADREAVTQTRVRLDVNAKSGENLKAKVQIENDWDTWGRLEQPQANGVTTCSTGTAGTPCTTESDAGRLRLREAWLDFQLPGMAVNVKAGHQLLQFGNGWFFRSQRYGSDAWMISHGAAGNVVAFVNVKGLEGDERQTDDLDIYMLADVWRISDSSTVALDITSVSDRRGSAEFTLGESAQLYNLGLHFNGKIGSLALKVEADVQAGSDKKASGTDDADFKGTQVVLQASRPVDLTTFTFTVARGSGSDGGVHHKEFITLLDTDPRYTFLYEYSMETAAGKKSTGFANTTAFSAGFLSNATKNVSLGADVWYLTATEDVALGAATVPASDLGIEIDARLNWKLYENLAWNWTLAYFKPGDAYGTSADAVTGLQGILSYRF